jgi:hypothetical protein
MRLQNTQPVRTDQLLNRLVTVPTHDHSKAPALSASFIASSSIALRGAKSHNFQRPLSLNAVPKHAHRLFVVSLSETHDFKLLIGNHNRKLFWCWLPAHGIHPLGAA